MLKFLFLVDRREKLEAIMAVAGDDVEVVVLDDWPASFSITPQGQKDSSVFSFQSIPSVWATVVDRIAESSDVYYCFDTSIEGEYISYLADQILSSSGGNMQGHRLHLAGVASDIITQSLSMVELIDEQACLRHLQNNLFHKVFFSHLARLLGTAQGPGGVELSISTLSMLALLAENNTAMKHVSCQQKWELEVRINPDGHTVSGRLAEVYGISSDGFLESREQAKEVAETLKGRTFSLVDQVEHELNFASPSLYTLPELVADAYRFYQISPANVVSGMQELFDGVHGNEGGLVSSPYGVSKQNLQPIFDKLISYIKQTYGDDQSVKIEFGDGGILPMNPALLPDMVELPPVLQQLYQLVWARSVASQMADAVGCERKFLFEVDGNRVSFSCLSLVSKGFLAVFKYGFDAIFAEDVPLSFQEGDTVVIDAVLPQQVKPQIAQYHIASLCDEMREMKFTDEKEILSVFQQLLDHNYVMLSGAGEILCSETLWKVVSTLDRAFPGMKGLNLSAYYGQTLDEVMSGRKRVDVALKQFDQNLVMQGNPLVKVRMPKFIPKIKRQSKNVIKGGGNAPSPDAVIEGFADFNASSQVEPEVPVESADEEQVEVLYEEGGANDAQPIVEDAVEDVKPETGAGDSLDDVEEEPLIGVEPEEELRQGGGTVEAEEVGGDVFEQVVDFADEPAAFVDDVEGFAPVASVDLSAVETKECPQCGRAMVVKDDRFGKFWACTGGPACHHSESYSQKSKGDKVQQCPACKRGGLSANRTPAGKDMYICSDPGCDFMAWSKPYAIDCPLCASPFLIEKKDRMGNVQLCCPMAGCSYVHSGDADAEVPKPKKKKVRVRRKKAGVSTGKKKRVVRRRKK